MRARRGNPKAIESTRIPTETTSFLRLLQVSDSGFPTGAFAFSHGLEGLCAKGTVTDERGVAAFVAAHLDEGFAGIECPALVWGWRFARQRDVSSIMELDAFVSALKPVPAFRLGSLRTGRGLLESTAGVLTGPLLDEFRERVRNGDTAGHHAVAFGIALEAAGVDEESAALTQGAGMASGLAMAAVRLGIIGQSAAQRIVAAAHPRIVTAVARGRHTPVADMGAFMPAVDIAGLRQPRLPGRIFAS